MDDLWQVGEGGGCPDSRQEGGFLRHYGVILGLKSQYELAWSWLPSSDILRVSAYRFIVVRWDIGEIKFRMLPKVKTSTWTITVCAIDVGSHYTYPVKMIWEKTQPTHIEMIWVFVLLTITVGKINLSYPYETSWKISLDNRSVSKERLLCGC